MPVAAPKRPNGFWRWIATLLATMLIGGTASFMALEHRVTAEEVKQLIKESSPYKADRGLLFEKIDQNKEAIQKLDRSVRQMNQKLDRILMGLPRNPR